MYDFVLFADLKADSRHPGFITPGLGATFLRPNYHLKSAAYEYCRALAGVAAIQWGLPKLQDYIAQKEPQEAVRLIQALLIVLFASVLPMAIYFYRFGRRIVMSGQCPPPEAKVIRDTEIIEGEVARRKGRLLIV